MQDLFVDSILDNGFNNYWFNTTINVENMEVHEEVSVGCVIDLTVLRVISSLIRAEKWISFQRSRKSSRVNIAVQGRDMLKDRLCVKR